MSHFTLIYVGYIRACDLIIKSLSSSVYTRVSTGVIQLHHPNRDLESVNTTLIHPV